MVGPVVFYVVGATIPVSSNSSPNRKYWLLMEMHLVGDVLRGESVCYYPSWAAYYYHKSKKLYLLTDHIQQHTDIVNFTVEHK
jgi:hypothetical protein